MQASHYSSSCYAKPPRYHSSSSSVYHSISPFLMAQQKTENPQPQSSTSARGLGLSYTHRRIQCMPVTLYKFWGEVVKGCCLNLGAPATLLLSSKLIPPPFSCLHGATHDSRVPCTCTRRGTIARIHLVPRKEWRTLHCNYYMSHTYSARTLYHSAPFLDTTSKQRYNCGCKPRPISMLNLKWKNIWNGRHSAHTFQLQCVGNTWCGIE